MRTKPSSIQDLRRVIDHMPVATRVAMLEGVRTHQIIAGAYTDRDGGVCPMLAAHRCGGRTDYDSFARAWDRFTGVVKRRSRCASRRELAVLTTHLEQSLLSDEQVDLGEAIAAHRATLALTRSEQLIETRERPGDPDRTTELARRAGWAWLRPFRRLDDYERALDRITGEQQFRDTEQQFRDTEQQFRDTEQQFRDTEQREHVS